ncbi:MAG: EAL domain-containing protein [Deltaproteobacteria bacterium]|nr:EAL domain-containing protein [Deltaproteobacteria bacterium]
MRELAVAPDPFTLDTTQLVRMIHGRTIRTLKQPIINLREKRQIGYEALSRGIHPDSGGIISAETLFGSARLNGLIPEIDKMCSDKAIATYVRNIDTDQMLFVNFDVSALEDESAGGSWILDKVAQLAVPPQAVAIEIVESRAPSDLALMRFVARHRQAGMKIVLDDFGTAHSNLDRLHMLRPDIVKIDRHLVQGIAEDHYRRSIVESIILLSEKVGALSLVEGVETIEDVLACVSLGVSLFQGFYFSEPVAADLDIDDQINARVDLVFRKSVEMLQKQWAQNRNEVRSYEQIVAHFVDVIARKGREGLDTALANVMGDAVGVECAYIVDSEGIQVTRTHFHTEDGERFFNRTSDVATRGTNHFLKHYFLKMKTNGHQQSLTRPYVSMATGNLCRTMGQMLQSSSGKVFYLFVDFNV